MLTYVCTIVGDGSTLWEGTAFDCPENGILLRHNLFNSTGGVTRICNRGAIVGRSVRVDNGCYTSQLNIRVTGDFALNNKSIRCVHNAVEVIGTSTLMILQGM